MEPRGEHGQGKRHEVAERRHPGEGGRNERGAGDDERGAAARAAATKGAAHDLDRAERGHAAGESSGDDVDPASRLPRVDAVPECRARSDGDGDREKGDANRSREQDARGCAEAGGDADPVPGAHPQECSDVPSGSALAFYGRVERKADTVLIFFTSRRSGPARRMESLLAHIARKERDHLAVKKVDVDERPDIAERFGVRTVPALRLVKGRRVVAQLDGRVTTPRIEEMLDSHLRAAA
ncbi:MAG: thioredoxin family protein [Actinobacteria bacterium]|nr:MAG: thioredoxin family protein [Actinomycetota bacterium]